MRALVAGLVVLLAISSCTLVLGGDLDDLSSGSPAVDASGEELGQQTSNPDGDTKDVAIATDSGDAGDAATNLLFNPGFEVGCAGWTVDLGEQVEVDVAKSGSKSCQICFRPSAGEVFLAQEVTRPVQAAETYLARIAYRDAPDADTPGNVAFRVLSLAAPGDKTSVDRGPTANAGRPPAGIWSSISASLTTTRDAGVVVVEINPGGSGPRGYTCVLVDDASLELLTK